MLLYHVIPYKDTNPVSKNLLFELGSLDAVFRAERDKLTAVSGVGGSVADFLIAVGQFMEAAEGLVEESPYVCYDNFDKVGAYLVDYFDRSTPAVAVMLFDNRMGLIGTHTLYDVDYESARVRADAFLNLAINARASVVVSAHTHPHGPLFPSVGDMATNRLVTEALEGAGIAHAEHYVVCGTSYVSSMGAERFRLSRSVSAELQRFLNSRRGG